MVIPSRDDLVRQAMDPCRRGYTKEIYSPDLVFSSVDHENTERRKAVVKAAIREASTGTHPRLPTTSMIKVCADAAERFLGAHRDEPLSFPLSDVYRSELRRLVGLQVDSLRAPFQKSVHPKLQPPAVKDRSLETAVLPSSDAIALAAFHEVRLSHRHRLQRLFARFDPSRIRSRPAA